MSKGSARRKSQISSDSFSSNWDNIFGNKKPTEVKVEEDKDVFYEEKVIREFEVGDFVCKKNGGCLRSGSEAYSFAVVISVEPFVLCSEESDMRWSSTVTKEEFKIIGKASQARLTNCLRRL